LSTVTAPAGVTGYSYDTLGRVATLTYPDTHVVTRSYDAADRLSSVKDWNNNTTSFGYDGDGNQTTTTYPNGVTDTTTLNAADQTTAITIKHGTTSLASFGYTPDAAGQVSASTDSLAPTLSTSYAYTALNQLRTVASASSHYTYDSSGNLTGLTNGTTQSYDAAGQLTQANATGAPAPTTFSYDTQGNRLTKVAPATSDDPVPTQLLTNTGFESALSHTNVPGGPLGETAYYSATISNDSTVSHSGTQSLKVLTNSAVNVQGFIQFPHTLAAAVAANTTVYGSMWIKAPAGTVMFASGRAMKADGSAFIGESQGGVTFTATGAWQQVFIRPFLINQAALIGVQCRLVTATSGLTFWADDTSLATMAASNSGDQQVLSNTGFESQLLYGNGGLGEAPYWNAVLSTDTTTAHTGAQSLKIVTNDATHPQGFFQFPHTLTAVEPANTTMVGSAWVKAPAGTGLYASAREQTPDGSAYLAEGEGGVAFNASGAWQQINLHPFVTTQAAIVGIQIHLANAASGITYWVDDTSMLATTAASYNQANELTAYTDRAVGATYTYNGDGLRATATTGGTTTNYGWDSLTGGVPVLLADATNDFIYGPGDTPIEQVNKTSGTATYLHGDQIGSIRVATDTSGNAAATTSYDPYGNLINQTGTTGLTPFGYSGEYTDPTGLIYLRARYYDPTTGQFLTIDPLVDSTRMPYAYAAGNPLNATDPSGMCGVFGNGPCWGGGTFTNILTSRAGSDALNALSFANNNLNIMKGPIDQYRQEIITIECGGSAWDGIQSGLTGTGEAVFNTLTSYGGSKAGEWIGQKVVGYVASKLARSATETAALDWSIVSKAGETRAAHVALHEAENASKTAHGVFTGDSQALTNEAWSIVRSKGIVPIREGGVDIYRVPMGRNVGYAGGGNAGELAGVPHNTIEIITRGGTNELITAYPVALG
jgi:RHS repeat-associated protein